MNRLNRIHFKIAFPDLISPVAIFWNDFTHNLDNEGVLPEKFYLSGIAGHPEHLTARRGDPEMFLTIHEISQVIVKRELTGFAVDTGCSNNSVRYHLRELCDLNNKEIISTEFYCEIGKTAEAPNSWKRLIEQLIFRWQSIGAWQYLLLYQAWQWTNVKRSSYENTYGPIAPGIKTYPDPHYDGLGENRIFIDIKSNPGRPKKLTPGVNFYPTAEMWLGPHFWQYAKCTKEEALAADFWLETRDTPHYTYFKCWPTAFTRPDGDQGRMQQRLWKLFFHEDCEWPPGSGTICDDPMYGPPELFP